MKAEEKPYSGEAEGKYFTARYQEERMYVQLSFGGGLKPALLSSKSCKSVGPLLTQTRMEGNQFSVVGMNLHPF